MATPEKMLEILKKKGKSSLEFHKGTVIHVHDKMQKGYSYTLEEEPGAKPRFQALCYSRRNVMYGCL